jgi:hypothetical protein
MELNISALPVLQRLKESFLTHNIENLTKRFVSFVDDNQRTDHSAHDRKSEFKIMFSKVGTEKE